MKKLDNTAFNISFGMGTDEVSVPDFLDDEIEQVAETRETVITRFIEDNDYFGLEMQSEAVIAWMVETLISAERQCAQYVDEFDISKVPVEDLTRLVQKWRDAFETNVMITDDARRQEIFEAYMVAFSDRPVVEIYHALAVNEELPEAVQLKAATYIRLISSDVVKNKSDREAIADKINQYSPATAPQPMWFVSSEVLGDDSLSDKSRKAIMKEFSLEPNAISGDTLTENIEKAKFVAVDRDIEASITDDGDISVALVGSENIDMPEYVIDVIEVPEVVGLKLTLLKLGAAMAGGKFFGLSVEPRSLIESGFANIDFDRFASILGAVLGGTGKYSGEILNDEQIDYLISFTDLCLTPENAALLGINLDGSTHETDTGRLIAAREFIQRQPVTEAIDIDKLHDHLTLILPIVSSVEGHTNGEIPDEVYDEEPSELRAA